MKGNHLQRRRMLEQMDDPLLDAREHELALQSLNRVNCLFRVHHRIMQIAIELAQANSFSILDVGAGGGGFLESCANLDRVQARNKAMRIGLDLSTRALILGRAWSPPAIQWIAGDARQIPLSDSSVDVVVSSLFLHHFDRDDVVQILRESLRVARDGIIMSDLTRSWRSFATTWLGTRVLSRSRVFRMDGPRSVRSAWTPQELQTLALQSGLMQPILSMQFPMRMLLTCKK